MKLTLGALAVLVVAGTVSAASVDVRVGKDDDQSGTAYLRYFPETVVVRPGDTVNWTAASGTPHTVTSSAQSGNDSFDSSPSATISGPLAAQWFGPGGFLLPGASFNFTFTQAGNYTYICKIHPGMVGRIRVSDAPAATSNGSAAGALPNVGGGNDTARTGPSIEYVTAGWGSGDTTVDRYGPAMISIRTGSTVVWTNMHSAEPHTVTGFAAGSEPSPGAAPTTPPAFDSSPNVSAPPSDFEGPKGVLAKGAPNSAFSFRFTTPGAYTYTCKLHPGMWGTVIVLDGPLPAGSPTTRLTDASGTRIPGFETVGLLAGLAIGAALLSRHRR